MNDTFGPEGVVPSAFVFGKFPCLRSFSGPVITRPSLAERALAAQDARRYIGKHLAHVRIKRALRLQTLQASDLTYKPGDKVLVWREKLVVNRIGEWTGPYTLCSYDAAVRIFLVQKEPESSHERCNIAQVRPLLDSIASMNHIVGSIASALNHFVTPSEMLSIFMT